MGPTQIALVLGILALSAHVVKGLTGFGSAVVFVSIGSLIYDPLKIIVLASVLDLIGGSYLSVLNPRFFENKKFWVPIGILMIVGAVIGSAALSILPPAVFEYFFGTAIILISLWFLLGRSEPEAASEKSQDLGILDGFVGVFSGFCGGFTGMAGPPLVAYMGSKFDKDLFRAILVPVFLMAATSRVISYGALGMLETSNLWIYVFPTLGVLIGEKTGNHFFEDVEQRWFTVLIGIILLLSGIRMLTG